MAKTVIAISFTLKGQSLESIREALQEIAAAHEGKDVLLVHGFLPREVLKEKNFGTEVVDMLDELFPNQANFYSPTLKKVERENMANYLKEVGGKAFIVGFVKEGVKEEVDLYRDVIGEDNIQFVATDELKTARDHAENTVMDIAEGKDLRQHPATEGESFSSLTEEEQNDVDGSKDEPAIDDLKSYTQDEVGAMPETSKKKSSKKKREEDK